MSTAIVESGQHIRAEAGTLGSAITYTQSIPRLLLHFDLDDEYGQTAKARFDPDAKMPSWSTASIEEMVNRRAMNESMVNKRVSRLSMLPDVFDEI